MTTCKLSAAAFVLLHLTWSLYGQEQPDADRTQVQRMVTLADQNARLVVAVATEEYPVTPGDVYTLTYLTAGQTVVYDIVVQSDYSVDLRVFGRLRGEGKSFQQLRTEAEAIIARAYPNSVPALVIRSVGVFPVAVKGAVKQPGRVLAWGLSRLSEIVRDGLETYASDRNVEIISKNGRSAYYDLYRAFRLGDDTQDPPLRVGDTVVVSQSARTVTVKGEVYRPGAYHLTDADTSTDLLQGFCGGVTSSADASRLRVERHRDNRYEVTYMSLDTLLGVALGDGDTVSVPNRSELLPIVTFEGAIRPSAAIAASTTIQTTADMGDPYGTLQVAITPGDRLLQAFMGIKDRLVPNADLGHAAILRGGQSLPVDLYRLTNEYSLQADPVLEPFDRILIPSTRYTVTISGAVVNPGSYYYTPGKPPSYYVALAGGADPERNAHGATVAYDAAGNTLPVDSVVLPGARIVLLSNNFAYSFNRYFPIITTTLTFVTAVIMVIDLLAR